MSVQRTADGTIVLSGRCGLDEAETLLRHVLEAAPPRVEWSGCEHAHTAIVQILLKVRPALQGNPADSFLAHHVAPLLTAPLSGEDRQTGA